MTLGQQTTPVDRRKDTLLETVGGGIDVRTLTGNITLGIADATYHVFTCAGVIPRTVTLPGVNTALMGLRHTITNSPTSTTHIKVQDEDGTLLGFVFPGGKSEFRQDGATYFAMHASPGSNAVRLNLFTSTADEITAVASAAAGGYIPFDAAVPLPASFLRAGSVLSAAALVQCTNPSGTVTLQTDIAVMEGQCTWTYLVVTNSNAEVYGVNLTRPATGSISYTSDASATKAEIAAGIVAAWNADATCAAYATATTDGVDTVTFTGLNGVPFTIVEDENAAKTTLTHTSTFTQLVESTAVDPTTTSDWQMLTSELNALENPAASAAFTAMGSWSTMVDVGGTNTLDSSPYVVLPDTLPTNGSLTLCARAKWSATNASTKAKLAQWNVWCAR